MISLASLTDTAFNFVAVVHPGGFVPWTWLLLKNVVSQALKPALVLKAAMRLDFRWDKMLPHLKRLPSSPLERRSERVDAKTPWIIRGGVSSFPFPHRSEQQWLADIHFTCSGVLVLHS